MSPASAPSPRTRPPPWPQALGRLVLDTLVWRGRASRRTFYSSVRLMTLPGSASIPPLAAWLLAPPALHPVATTPLAVLPFLMTAFFLGAFVRRLHDRGKGAVWLLLFFGPFAGAAGLLTLIPDDFLPVSLLVGFLF